MGEWRDARGLRRADSEGKLFFDRWRSQEEEEVEEETGTEGAPTATIDPVSRLETGSLRLGKGGAYTFILSSGREAKESGEKLHPEVGTKQRQAGAGFGW